MAKVRLTEGGFNLMPVGVHTFKITEVDDSKYEDFGKLTVKMQTQSGVKHSETFTLVKADGEINEGAMKAFSYFAKTALNNFNLNDQDIDTDDLVDCYITATIKHEEFESNKEPGKMLKSARMSDWEPAVSFGASAASSTKTATKPADNSDLDDLDDL